MQVEDLIRIYHRASLPQIVLKPRPFHPRMKVLLGLCPNELFALARSITSHLSPMPLLSPRSWLLRLRGLCMSAGPNPCLCEGT